MKDRLIKFFNWNLELLIIILICSVLWWASLSAQLNGQGDCPLDHSGAFSTNPTFPYEVWAF